MKNPVLIAVMLAGMLVLSAPFGRAETPAGGHWSGLDAQWAALEWTSPAQMTHEAASLKTWLATLPAKEADLAMGLILVPDFFAAQGPGGERYNPNLELLARLARAAPLPAGDTIGLALILANTWFYSKAAPPVRSAIVTDLANQLAFYQETLDWQKQNRFPWSLDRLAILEKTAWAQRYRLDNLYRTLAAMGSGGSLTMDIYREYVDRVDTLRAIAAELRGRNLATASFSATIRNLETSVYPDSIYRHSIKPEAVRFLKEAYPDLDLALSQIARGESFIPYAGKVWEWQNLSWINYQWNERRRKGLKYIGDCGTRTSIMMAYFRALGIAPLSLQRTYDDTSRKVWPGTHNFPAAFDPASRRWHINQAIDPTWPDFDPKAMVEVWIDLPLPPPQNAGNDIGNRVFYRETTRNDRLSSLTRLGLDAQAWEDLVVKGPASSPKVFTDRTTPYPLNDSDQDGLWDTLEVQQGLDPKNWDSDGDGASDWWEADQGRDPRAADSGAAVPILDGFMAGPEKSWLEQAASAADARGDPSAKGSLDIGSFLMRIDNGSLVMGAEYWPSSPGKHRWWHSFSIRTFGSELKDWWFQGNAQDGWTYVGTSAPGKPMQALPLPGNADFIVRRDGEFRIPLALFGPCSAIQAVYWTSGDKNQTESEVCSDSTATLWLPTGTPLPVPDGDCRELLESPGLIRADDPSGDVASGSWDISLLGALIQDGRLRVATRFASPHSEPSRSMHTLHIQAFGSTKVNWWLQGNREWGLCGFTKFSDGEQGQSFPPGGRDFRLAVGKDAEWQIPLELFGDAKVLCLRVLADGIDSTGSYLFGADTSPWLILELPQTAASPPRVAVDGQLADLAALAGSTTVDDPRGDGTALRYPDLRRALAAASGGRLVLGAESWAKPDNPLDTWLSAEIQDSAGRSWWIQGCSAAGVTWISRAEAGSRDYRKLTSLKPQDSILLWNGAWEWSLPRSWFPTGALKVRLHLSGTGADSKLAVSADTSDWMELR